MRRTSHRTGSWASWLSFPRRNLTVASKVLRKIILERMTNALEGKLRDEQAGFRKERSCCNQIATLRIMMEQILVWNTRRYMVFVDFEKAFDSVDRNVLWKILRHYGAPEKIFKAIRIILIVIDSKQECCMKVTGVRQGCLLSLLLSLVALDWVSIQAFGD